MLNRIPTRFMGRMSIPTDLLIASQVIVAKRGNQNFSFTAEKGQLPSLDETMAEKLEKNISENRTISCLTGEDKKRFREEVEKRISPRKRSSKLPEQGKIDQSESLPFKRSEKASIEQKLRISKAYRAFMDLLIKDEDLYCPEAIERAKIVERKVCMDLDFTVDDLKSTKDPEKKTIANFLESKYKILVPGGRNYKTVSKAVEEFVSKKDNSKPN